VRASDGGTVVFVLAAVLSASYRPLHLVAVVVSLMAFAVGCATFLWAFWLAVQRSRVDTIAVAGLFFLLQGSAPRAVRVRLLGALAVQVVVAVATASARPFTDQAFAILGPMLGLGLTGLWGARHGQFPPRALPVPDP